MSTAHTLKDERECLAGTLAHLSALAAETTHALLLPLLAHTAVDVEEHGEGVLVLDAVAGEGAALEDLGAVDEADEVGGDEGLVLDHGLDGLDRGVGLDGVRVGVDENLHVGCLYNLRLLKPGGIRHAGKIRWCENRWRILEKKEEQSLNP